MFTKKTDRMCHDSDEKSDRNFDLEAEVRDTEDQCRLRPDETGCQRVQVTSYRRHAVTGYVRLESNNDCVEFEDDGCELTNEITLSKASHDGPSWAMTKYQLSRTAEDSFTEETLRTQFDYSLDTDADPDECVDGPTANPRVGLR